MSRLSEQGSEATLSDRSPHNVNLRMALTDVYGQLGARSFYRGQITEMNAWFEKAQRLWQLPASETPVDSKRRYYFAKVTEYRAWTAEARFDHPLALQLSLRATDIWQELSDEQKANLEILERLTEVRRQLMVFSCSTHGRDESFEWLKNRKAKLSSLVRKNSTVIVLRKRLR